MKQIIEQIKAAAEAVKALKPQTDFSQAAINRLESACRNLEEDEKKRATLPAVKPAKAAAGK